MCLCTNAPTGFTLGGGFDYLSRHLGLGCDQLVGLEAVTEDGRVVYADASEQISCSCKHAGQGILRNAFIVVCGSYHTSPVGSVCGLGVLYCCL